MKFATNIACLSFVCLFALSFAHHNCGTMDFMESIFAEDENARAQFFAFHQSFYERMKSNQHARADGPFRIPVVFHILQNANVPVVSEAQINLELSYLNDWFSANNAYYGTTSGYWEDEMAVESDFGISFELAAFDPLGNPTNGILFYQNNPVADVCAVDNLPSAGIGLWNPEQYCNIALCRTGNFSGFANIPGTKSLLDGIVFNIDYLANSEYLGSDLAHLAGHYLGLFHPYQGCLTGDYVDDTPNTGSPSFELYSNPFCPAQGAPDSHFLSPCNDEPYMTENVMDVNVAECIAYFSKGQVARMRRFLSETIRSGLTSSPGLARCANYNCAGKDCGSDGCGGVCGVCFAEDTCNANNQCVHVPAVNEECQSPYDLLYLPNTVYTTYAVQSPLQTGVIPASRDCSGIYYPLWYIIPGTFVTNVTITTYMSLTDTVINVYDDAASCSSACVYSNDDYFPTAGFSQVSFCTAPFTEYVIAVGSAGPNDWGNITLSISTGARDSCCLPDCSGKECGDDGCGGSCPNTCSSTERCVNNVCVASASTPSPSRSPNAPASSSPSPTKQPPASASTTPSRTRTPPPNNNPASAEITITLRNNTNPSSSEIKRLISSELNAGADVTVVDLSQSKAVVLICDSTNAALSNLLLAFDDGSFNGSVLDGAKVDSVDPSVDCDTSNTSDRSNSGDSSSSDSSRSSNSSSATSVICSIFAFVLVFLNL